MTLISELACASVSQMINHKLSKWKKAGDGFAILTPDMMDFVDSGIEDGDVPIHYDYCDDELTDEEREEFCDWLHEFAFPKLHEFMNDLGYEEISNNDGSGGGLIYGYINFRKA